MNVLIGLLIIAFSSYIYFVNKPESLDSKIIFCLLLFSGAVLINGYLDFKSALRAVLSVVSILSVITMFVGFYCQICVDAYRKTESSKKARRYQKTPQNAQRRKNTYKNAA